MSVYTGDQERAIRLLRLVKDWARSGLITEAQRTAAESELQVDVRRTNKFLRATLFLFGLLILQSFTLLLATGFSVGEGAAAFLCAVNAGLAYYCADVLVTRFKLYRFGIEEAAAAATVGFAAAAGGLAIGSTLDLTGDAAVIAAMAAGGITSLAIFRRFGYVYAAIVSMMCAAAIPFVPGSSDMLHRLISGAVLVVIFSIVRSRRQRHGTEFPGDVYGILEAAAWIGIYLLANLHLSAWLSHPEQRGAFYWATYAATWILPMLGMWMAINDRHRLMLGVNIVMAIATLVTNKPYLGAPRQPYDPIAFGLLLIGAALAVRRWLASGEDRSRNGFIAERLLDSEKGRLGVLATLSVVHQGPVASPAHQSEPPAIGSGGRSGGAGATESF